MKKIWILFGILLSTSLSMAQTTYMPAVYPQQQSTPGAAQLNKMGDVFTLSNELLSADFILHDGKLTFGGCDAMNLLAGTELFQIQLGTTGNIVRNASELTLDDVWMEDLPANSKAIKGAEHFGGKALCARFLHGTSGIILWRAVLRDGSHYLRTEMDITPAEGKSLRFYDIYPMLYKVDASAAGSAPRTIGNTRGAVLLSDKIFAGLETPTGYNTSSADTPDDGYETIQTLTDAWQPTDWKEAAQGIIPARINEVGFYYPDVMLKTKAISISQACRVNVEFVYKSGSHRMNLCGADIIDADGNIVASDYHFGYTGGQKQDNIYTFEVPFAGNFTLRYWGEKKTESINSSGDITVTLQKKKVEENEDAKNLVDLQGRWSRRTSLASGETWKVSAVIGLVSPGQARRSFLAYSERERAVPWRPYPCYISWYELNIDRNNAKDPTQNMNSEQVLDVLNHWKTDMYDKYGVGPKSFVIDDGWDNYGTWTFHTGFPNEMRDMASKAKEMEAGVGAWLGPVGGYGTSGNYRRNYWNTDNRGGMVLSNPAYYKVFKDAAYNLTQNQGDFNFFKFDGISAQFSAVGPDDGDTGNENAEGIIRLERYVREELKEDIFFNTTVGTWASPFWYHYTDATWRQENDYSTIGNNTIDRENWITYRDRLVYNNYVKNSPLCPINTLMTHGFILTKFGNVSKNMDYNAVLRELRCAFACGSGMVELYNDYALMNSINGGKLWADLAECIEWQKRNADVLPDVHWVGGNPWDGSKSNVYGWASWNGRKCTVALRNGSNAQQTFTTTLREMLDIPESVHGRITLQKAFKVQNALSGLKLDAPIDIDEKLSLKLPASSVFVFDGVDSDADHITFLPEQSQLQDLTMGNDLMVDLSGRILSYAPQKGVYIKNGKKVFK